MTIPATVTPERLQIAISALVEIQAKPNHFTKHKTWAWEALDALAPELSLLPPAEAYELLTHPKESRS